MLAFSLTSHVMLIVVLFLSLLFVTVLEYCLFAFTALTLLGGRKGIRPVKNEWWGAGVVVYLERGAALHMAQLMPLPLTHRLLLQLNPDWFYLSGTG